MPNDRFTPTPKTSHRRKPKRGAFDRETIYRILDEGLVCHIGFAVAGQPYVIPVAYARRADRLILHGSTASRLFKRLGEGFPACVAVTVVDGLVLARSAFHHSMNYRSVVAFGRAQAIQSRSEKAAALTLLVEHLVPGRSADARGPTDSELDATAVLEFPLEEASAKARMGPPIDDPEDLSLGIWAGVIPLRTAFGPPEPSTDSGGDLEPPAYVTHYRRPL